MHLRKVSLALLLALLIPACSERPPIPESKFVNFYIQLQLMDARYGNDIARQKAKADSLMSAFGLDKKLFDSTMAWYGKRPDRWEKFFAKVKQRLAEMKPQFVKPKSR